MHTFPLYNPVVIYVALALKENDSWAGGVHHRVLLTKYIKAALKVDYNVYTCIFSIIVKHSYLLITDRSVI